MYICASDGVLLPRHGFERYCGKQVYMGVAYDAKNDILEVDESNNIAMTTNAVAVTGLECEDLPTHSQSCK